MIPATRAVPIAIVVAPTTAHITAVRLISRVRRASRCDVCSIRRLVRSIS
jgi:hypothetical protein